MENKDNNKKNFSNKWGTLAVSLGIVIVMALVFASTWRKTVQKQPIASIDSETTEESSMDLAERNAASDKSEARTGTLSAEKAVNIPDAVSPEEDFKKSLSWITSNPEGAKVDYSQSKYTPGKRNASLKWSDEFYNKIENPSAPDKAAINEYTLTKRQAVLDNGMYMVFEVYTNPENGKNEKIVSIEHNGEYVNVVSYYFKDDKLNYAFTYQNDIYFPGDIYQVTSGDRYCFVNDTLVRYITDNGTEKMDLNLTDRDKYSDGTREVYDYQEKKLINDAYITYKAVQDIPEAAFIEGYVLDEFNQPMSDAQVQVYSNQQNTVAAKVTTNGDGYYKTQVPVSDAGTYNISVEKNTLETARLLDIPIQSGTLKISVPNFYMAYAESGSEYTLNISILSAENNKSVPKASLIIREGFGCKDGAPLKTLEADGSGTAKLTMQAGNYTAEIQRNGYETAFCNVVVKTDSSTMKAYLVPEVKEGTYQVVLSKDDDTLDIRGHLIEQAGTEVSTTPTLLLATVSNMDGSYKYFVTDQTSFVNQNNASYTLSSSGAKIELYDSNGLLQTCYVPTAHLGVVWEAFEIRKGKIMPVQLYEAKFYDRLFQ